MIRNGVCFFAFFLLLVAGCAQVVSMDDAEDDAVSEETDNRASSKKDKKTLPDTVYTIDTLFSYDTIYEIDTMPYFQYDSYEDSVLNLDTLDDVISVPWIDTLVVVDSANPQIDTIYVHNADSTDKLLVHDTVSLPIVVYDTLYDYRTWGTVSIDTVAIGNQVWFSSNLWLKRRDHFCFDDVPENCEKIGGLYTWETALSLCPAGWRLPSKEDFEILIDYIGGASVANEKLKSRVGWSGGKNGLDEYHLDVFPAGYRNENGGYEGYGERGGTDVYYWTSDAYALHFAIVKTESGWKEQNVGFERPDKNAALSVRCIKIGGVDE